MKRMRRRRSLFLLILAVATVLYAWAHLSLETRLLPAARGSGILLFVLTCGLALFNARKKLPFIPLMSATTWMQVHIYAGFFAALVFLFHTGFRAPTGGLEIVTYVLFAAVALSGVFGLALSRFLPPRLTAHGENVVFERIPGMIVSLRREVEQLIVAAEARTHSTTIAEFYEARLAGFFARPRHLWSHLVSSPKPLNSLLERIDALDRYLDEDERETSARIAGLVRAKSNLDHQWHLQGLLKVWLFAHIPLSFALLLFAAIHGWIAWRFTG